MDLIAAAIQRGQTALSEFESKQLLARYKIPVAREALAGDEKTLLAAAGSIGYPIVLKGCAPQIAHKTEDGLVHVDIRNDEEARSAFGEIMARVGDPEGSVLVQKMIRGRRELVAGLQRDPQFGPCVMFGLGGIFTEILGDVSFRVAPLARRDALEMMREIRGHQILDAFRGMPAVDLDLAAGILVALGKIGMDHPQIREIDINPLIVSGTELVAVDALVALDV